MKSVETIQFTSLANVVPALQPVRPASFDRRVSTYVMDRRVSSYVTR